jgi:hypothetical protein
MMSIVFGGIAMALGISFGIQNVLVLAKVRDLLLPQLAFTLVGFIAAGVSLRWLLSSVEILDEVSEIRDDYEREKAKPDDESIAGLVVKMMAYYRDNKSTLQRLSLLSRVAGICFIVNGLALLLGATSLDLFTLTGSILCLAVGSSGLIVPHFFKNYSSVWEYRLQQSAKAERELAKELEGT